MYKNILHTTPLCIKDVPKRLIHYIKRCEDKQNFIIHLELKYITIKQYCNDSQRKCVLCTIHKNIKNKAHYRSMNMYYKQCKET